MFAMEICADFLCFVFIRFGFWHYSGVTNSLFFCRIGSEVVFRKKNYFGLKQAKSFYVGCDKEIIK